MHSSHLKPFTNQIADSAHFQIQTVYQQRGQGGEVWSREGEMGESDEGQRKRVQNSNTDRNIPLTTCILYISFPNAVFKGSF